MHDISIETAASIAQQLFPIASVLSITPLPSYDDTNFHIFTTNDSMYSNFVLKIHNQHDSTHSLQHIEAQHALLQHLAQHGIPTSTPLPGRGGQYVLHAGPRIVRALSFIPGTVLANVQPTPSIRRALGRMVGRMTLALTTFDHPGGHRTPLFDWDIRAAPSVVWRLAHLSSDAACVAGKYLSVINTVTV